jgi:hypothetical protein
MIVRLLVRMKNTVVEENILYRVIVAFSMCRVMKWYRIINEDFFNVKSAVVT